MSTWSNGNSLCHGARITRTYPWAIRQALPLPHQRHA